MNKADARLKMYNATPKHRAWDAPVMSKSTKRAADNQRLIPAESSMKKIAIAVIGGIAAAYSIKHLKKMGVL